jgi:large subunit ribosomal protein L9
MQVILLEKVDKLGIMGQTVSVKPGYARNYLLPTKKAMRATKSNLEFFDAQRAVLEANNLKRRQDAEEAAKRMNGVSVTLVRQASEMGILYGSVRGKDIADLLADKGFKIDRNQVQILTPIKTLGTHSVVVVLHPEVKLDVKVIVAQSLEEAQAQENADASDESSEDAA